MTRTIDECLGVKHTTIPGVDQTTCYMCGADLGPKARAVAERNKDPEAKHKMFADWPVFCEFCWTRLTSIGKEAQDRAIRNRRIEDTYAAGRLPEEARYVEFGSTFEARNPVAFERLRQAGNAWIYGPQGTGKTCMGYCILNKAAGDGHAVACIRAVDINTWRFDDKAEMERYSKAAYLMIDDLDKPEWTPRGMEMLWAIIDAWYRHKGDKLMITCNSDPEGWNKAVRAKHPQLANHINTIFDRVGHAGRGGCERIEVGGKSWRRAANG